MTTLNDILRKQQEEASEKAGSQEITLRDILGQSQERSAVEQMEPDQPENFRISPLGKFDPEAARERMIMPEEAALVESWNPAEILAGIWGGAAFLGVKGGKTAFRAGIEAVPESVVGTITDVPVSLVSQTLRERYGWGVGIATDLTLGIGAAQTVDRFLLNRLSSLGKKFFGVTKDLDKLKKLSAQDQNKAMEELEQLLGLATDRGTVLDSAGEVLQTSGDEMVDLSLMLRTQQTENITIRPIPREADQAAKGSFEQARRLDTKIKRPGKEETISRASQISQEGQEQIKVQAKRSEKVQARREFEQARSQADELSELPEPARSMARRAREASAKKQQEVLDEYNFWVKMEDSVNEEAAISHIQEMRRAKTAEQAQVFEAGPYLEKDLKNARAKPGENLQAETTPSVVRKKNGEPFTTEKSATRIAKKDWPDTSWEIIQEKDGFAIRLLHQEPDLAQMSPKTDPATKIDLGEREALIRQITAKKGVTKVSLKEELQADVAQIAGDLSPEDVTKTPPAPGRTQAEKDWLKAHKEMEVYLGEMDELEGGLVKKGFEEDVSFGKESRYYSDDYQAYLEDIESDPDAVRGFGDTLTDLYTVFGNKLGMSVEDVASGATRDVEAAARRLGLDLKRNYRQALKGGVNLYQHYLDHGFSEEMAQKMATITEAWADKSGYKFVEAFSHRSEGQEADVDLFDPWAGAVRRVGSAFSVEYPFRKIGARDTGFQFKVWHSIKDAHQNYGLKFLTRKLIADKQIRYNKLSKAQQTEALLKAEDSTYDLGHLSEDVRFRVEKAATKFREFYDEYYKIMEAEGLLQKPFRENFIARKELAIERLQNKVETSKRPEIRENREAKIADLQAQIETVRGTEYVPAFSEWLDLQMNGKTKLGRQAVRIFAQKKRKRPTLKGLLEVTDAQGNPLVKKEDINPSEMLAAYVTRTGSDIANRRLRNALLKDGLITEVPKIKGKYMSREVSKEKRDWPWIDSAKLPDFRGYKANPRVKTYLEDFYSNIGDHGYIDKALTSVKMFQFFNPFILGIYNTYQTTMLHGASSWRIPAHLSGAIRDVMTNSKAYREASELGLTSKPFSNPLGSWQDTIKNAQMPMKNRILSLLNPNPVKVVKNAYNISWDMAWTMDPILRMASYRELQRRGFGNREAAQIAALFHGDYASVPPKTRRKLNRLFFTPTFKIVMAQLNKQMIESAVKAGQEVGKKQLPNMRTRALAGGLVGLVAGNMAKDMLMRHYGYERDEWGRRYSKEIETDEGMREVVMTFSDPTNSTLKYVYRVQEALWGEPTGDTAIGKFLKSMSYDLHPLYRIVGQELSQNRSWNGRVVYDPNEDRSVKVRKVLEYGFQQILPAVQLVGYRPEDAEDRESLDKHFGKFFHNVIRTVAFPYMRKTETARARYQTQVVLDQLRKAAQEERLTQDIQENAVRKLQEINAD